MIKKVMIAAISTLALQANAAGITARGVSLEGITVDASVSTLGLGISGSYPLTDSLAIRGQYNQFTYGTEFDDSDIKYDADLDLSSIGIIADWYVISGSGFRISAGAYYNNNTVDASGTPKAGNQFDLGGTLYSLDSLKADVEFDSFAPYLGIGWTSGSATEAGLVFSADIGAFYQGSADITMNAAGQGLGESGFEEDLQKEVERLEDELKNLKIYPVATLSVGYRF